MSEYPDDYRARLRQIMEDPAFVAAVSSVKEELYSEWDAQTDAMERDVIYHTRRGLERLVNRMTNLAHG